MNFKPHAKSFAAGVGTVAFASLLTGGPAIAPVVAIVSADVIGLGGDRFKGSSFFAGTVAAAVGLSLLTDAVMQPLEVHRIEPDYKELPTRIIEAAPLRPSPQNGVTIRQDKTGPIAVIPNSLRPDPK